MRTTNEAVELLIALRNREINNAEYFRTQANFDDYVDSWMKNSKCEENEETLKEAAFNAVVYDGFGYVAEA
jgi:hypothetical protein